MKKIAVLFVLSLLLLAAQAQAQFCGARVIGTYLINVWTQGSSDKQLVSRSVVSLTISGTMTVIDSNQGGDGNSPFTAALGAWECDDFTSFEGRTLDFSIGTQKEIARVDYEAEVDSDGDIDGTAKLRFFDLTDDPQDDDQAKSTLEFDIEGVKVKAD